MMNKLSLTAALALASIQGVSADPAVGSVWGHPNGAAAVSTAGPTSICSDSIARTVGDLVTIVVDLQNTVTKVQDTKTDKESAVAGAITQLVYPNDGTNHGWNWYAYHGQTPGVGWNSTQSFNGGGTVNNTEISSTTIQARVIGVGRTGCCASPRPACRRRRRRHEHGPDRLVPPEDLSTANSVSSSRVADLQILQKGKGTLTNNQRKGC